MSTEIDTHVDGVVKGIIKLERQNEHLVEALRDCLEYFQDEYDIDNDGGPNKPMRLGQMVEEALSFPGSTKLLKCVGTSAAKTEVSADAEMLDALKDALKLAILANELTGCRGDDDYVWGVQAKILAAILKAEPDFRTPQSPFRADA